MTRSHGEGTVIKRTRRRKDGTRVTSWVAVVTAPDGSRPSAWRDTPEEAEAARLELLRLHGIGRLDATRLTLGDFLLRWADGLDMAPETVRKHRIIVKVHLVPALGRIRLAALSPSDVNRYLARTQLHPQTLRHHRATLRRALADALRDGLVTRNVAALSRAPRLSTPERSWLDADQARRLMDATKGTRIHAPVVLALCTGMRQAELLGLAWSDIDMKGGYLTVRHTLHRVDGQWVRLAPKTVKSRRTVDLVPLALDTLREHRRAQDALRGASAIDGLVFTTERGYPIHGPNLLPPLRAALKAAGLPLTVTWHDLRHSTASILLAAGVPIEVISRILGHSTTRVTADLYAHVVPELKRDAAAKLQDALGGA